jgi:endonuclease-3
VDSVDIRQRVRRVDAALAGMYGPRVLRPRGDALGTLVHTILTQNTSDANSDRTFAALRAAYPDWEALARAPAGDIAKVIRTGGLADIKANRLKQVLETVRSCAGRLDLGFLSELSDEEAFDYLTSLPGVGPKTAACVLLFALGRPVFPVDTHVHRVANRVGLVHTSGPAKTQEVLAPLVPPEIVYQFHMNMVTHGRRTCRAGKPRCEACSLAPGCEWAVRNG